MASAPWSPPYIWILLFLILLWHHWLRSVCCCACSNTLLPIALLRVRITPKSWSHLSPYEVLYGRPFLSTDLPVDPETHYLVQYLPTLGLTLKNIRGYQDQNSPKPDPNFSETPPHLNLGHWVYVKTLPQDRKPLEAVWTGPHQVLLVTPAAAKIQGFTPWIRASRLKTAPPPEEDPQTTEDSTDISYDTANLWMAFAFFSKGNQVVTPPWVLSLEISWSLLVTSDPNNLTS